MKKGILVIILSMIILCMSSCASRQTNQKTTPQDNQAEQMVEAEDPAEVESEIPSKEVDETESVDEAESVASEEDVTIEAPDYLDVVFDRHWDSRYEETSLMYARYNSMNLRTTEFPALTNAVNAFNADYVSKTQSYIDQIEENALYDYEEWGAEQFMGPYVYESDMFVKRADDEVFSVEEVVYSYEGGAHGGTFFNAYNFDVQTGAEISLEDVITDMNSLPGILETEVLGKYPDLGYYTDTLEGTFQEYITPTNSEYVPLFTWTLGYDGVTFYFGNYEIASYADGVQQVTVLYNEYPQIFKENYSFGVDQSYVIKADRTWGGMDTDLNGDGITDYISVTRNYNADTDFSESYNVTVNGNTFTQETYCYDLETYLVKSKGSNYLYVQRTVENDYQSVCVFEITESSVEYMGEFSGGMGSFTNSLDFEIAKRMDLLSTYTAMARCYVGADGMPVESNGVYEVKNDMSITSTVEITAELVDEEGNLSGTSYTFPAGTAFTFKRTDGEAFVDVLASDGQLCRFYTGSEWPSTVNGMNAEDSFEMLWYAG